MANQALGLLGLASATATAAMVDAAAYPGWAIAIATGLLSCGIIHVVRRDTPGWPLEELLAGTALCLAVMVLAWLHASQAQTVWLTGLGLVALGIPLLLWLLTRQTRIATIAARAMLAAIPPLATLMHHFC